MTRKEELEILIRTMQNMVSSQASTISNLSFDNKYFKQAFKNLSDKVKMLEDYINEIEKL